jgi:ABC-type glycerol-3-phosphate transport system substrate-binding protein
MRTAAATVLAFALVLAACGGGTDLTETQEELLLTEDGVTAQQVSGTWVFTHDPDAFNEALHSGVPEIRDGCLYVDDTIVVWHASDIAYAEQLVEDVEAGMTPDVLVPGGGLSLDEGASPIQIPKTIRDRCPTNAVWFAGPLN